MRMRRQALLNLFMLLLVGALALVVLLGPEPDQPSPETPLGPPDLGTVTRIEVAFGAAPPLHLELAENRWRLADHPLWVLDQQLIEALLALPRSISHARYPLSEIRPAALGLTTPRLRVRLNDAEYRFGDQEPIRHRRYVQIGDTVHLITDTLIHQLGPLPTDWVSRKLLPEGARVTRLTLPSADLRQDPGGTWQVTPASASLTQERLNDFIDRWRNARALSVSLYQPAPKAERLRIELGPQREPLIFEIVEESGSWSLQRKEPGLRYHLGAEVATRLLNPLPARKSDVPNE
ncbi:MAG: hypothetical protein Kow006_03270 [Gammaproteobacteria bacterium]